MRFELMSCKNFPARNFYRLSAIAFILLSGFVNVCFSQDIDSFTIKRFTSTTGLPQNTIRSMAMDDSRFLWMTTEEGLVRFDGRNFKIFNQTNFQGINNDRFRTITRTMDHELLVNELTGAVFQIKNGFIRLISKGDPANPITYAMRGVAPDVAFFVESTHKNFSLLPTEDLSTFALPVMQLPGNQYGLFIREGKLFRVYKGTKIIREVEIKQNKPQQFFAIGDDVYFCDAQKNIYHINSGDGVVSQVNISGDITLRNMQSKPGLPYIIWNAVHPDVYYKNKNFLYSVTTGQDPTKLISKLITAQLPLNCNITDVFFDVKSQNFFIGTDTKGLYIFKKNKVKTLINSNLSENLTNSYYSQCDIDSHTVFTPYQKEFTINGGRKSRLAVPNCSQECLIKDKENRMYYTIIDSIFYLDLDDGTKGLIPAPYCREYYCFEADGDSILVGNEIGIGYIKNLKYHHIFHRSDLAPDTRIEYLKRGPDGNIWIARCRGVAYLEAETGLLKEIDGLKNICARVFFLDGDKMFIGTYGDGFYVWQNGKVTKLPVDKNQYLSHVHSFFIDNNNFMWLSTNNGLFRTRYQNILDYIENQNNKIHYESFGNDDGIINTEFNGGCTPPVIRLKDGYVSYPTMEGLVWLIPEMIGEEHPDEKIIIDELYFDKQQVSLASPAEIPANHEMVEIHFATPYWGNSDNLNLEYKLEGLNRQWTPLNANEDYVRFSNLSSGNYQFKIRKLQKSGSLPYIETSIGFHVHKKFYESTVFLMFAILSFAGLIYLFIVLNSRRIIKKNIELEQRIAERTVELKNVNEQLSENFVELAKKEHFLRESIEVKNQLISIISHDIITPLKFISMVSRISKKNPDMLDRNKLIDSMNDIEFASDKLYNNASNILNWMKFQNNRIIPKKDHIGLHDFIEEIAEPLKGMAETKSIRIKNEVPEEDIILSDRTILMIVLQNILSNAIKYSEKGNISITTQEEELHYLISISDNGIGMTPDVKSVVEQIISRNDQITSAHPETNLGNQLGYYIITDFLQLLGGYITVDSTVGKGTTVTIGIPL